MAEQRLRVYLETSFVSYLTGGETDNAKIASEQAYSRQWWAQERPKCEVFASVYTSAESEKGSSQMVDRRKRILADVLQLELQAHCQSAYVAENSCNHYESRVPVPASDDSEDIS